MKKYKIREYHKYGYIDFPDIYDTKEEAEEVIRAYIIDDEDVEDGEDVRQVDYVVRAFYCETSKEEDI